MDPLNVPAKFELCSFTRSWDNSDRILGLANPQSLGKTTEEEALGGRRWPLAPFERALVSSYMPSIVIFPLCLRVSARDIAAFVL